MTKKLIEMKKYIMSVLLCMLFGWQTYGQNRPITEVPKETKTVTTGFSFKFHSDILNEDRIVMVSLPEGYDTSMKKYPVLYMLDAQWNFNHASQNIGWLSSNDNKVIPQTIIVGVCTGGERREHDLTPTVGTGTGGGADSLYLFIKKELIPYIDTNLRTFNYRILAGTSYGGLFVINAFVKDPLYFNGYLAASPSIWWDNQYMLRQTENLLSKVPKLPTGLYLNVANEGVSMGVDSLAALLSKYAPQQLVWKFDKHPDEIHNTINYKGLWDGMKFLLKDWYYPLVDFTPKDAQVSIASERGMKLKPIKLSRGILTNYSGLYKDSYGRLLQLYQTGDKMRLSIEHLPPIDIYPESTNRFYLNPDDLADKFFQKNTLVELEFLTKDSLTMAADGKNICTANRITRRALFPLSEKMISQYIGSYSDSESNIHFDVMKEDGGLVVSNETLKCNLLYSGGQHFLAVLNDEVMELEFTADSFNTITDVNVMKGEQIVVKARREGVRTNSH